VIRFEPEGGRVDVIVLGGIELYRLALVVRTEPTWVGVGELRVRQQQI